MDTWRLVNDVLQTIHGPRPATLGCSCANCFFTLLTLSIISAGGFPGPPQPSRLRYASYSMYRHILFRGRVPKYMFRHEYVLSCRLPHVITCNYFSSCLFQPIFSLSTRALIHKFLSYSTDMFDTPYEVVMETMALAQDVGYQPNDFRIQHFT